MKLIYCIFIDALVGMVCVAVGVVDIYNGAALSAFIAGACAGISFSLLCGKILRLPNQK